MYTLFRNSIAALPWFLRRFILLILTKIVKSYWEEPQCLLNEKN